MLTDSAIPAVAARQGRSGRWMLGAAMGIQAILGGLLYNAFGTYVVPLQNEFGWSKTTVAGAYSLQQAESGILGPIQGYLIGRFGARAIVQIGIVLCAIGFFLFSFVESLATFYGFFFVLALGGSLAGYLSLSTAVVQRFDTRRTLALGLLSTGTSFSGLFVPLLAIALTTAGWRLTAQATAIGIIAIGLPLSLLLGSGRPAASPSGPVSPQLEHAAADFTLRETLRRSSFWYLAVGHAVGALLYSAVSVHLVSAVITAFGTPLEVAALAMTLTTTMNGVGQLSGGLFGDLYDKRKICIACMVAMTAGMTLLALASNYWMVVAFAAVYGIALGSRGPVIVALRADYFGRTHFAAIQGVSMSIVTIGSFIGPLLVGALADLSGSYQLGFGVLGVLAALGTSCFVFARRPGRLTVEG